MKQFTIELQPVKYCKMCSMSSATPDIKFNEQGLCSDCVRYLKHKSSLAMMQVPTRKMEEGFAKVREQKIPYHALIRYSGGKDSAYLLWLVKNKYKLRPLAFSCIHPFVNEVAQRNMEDVARKLKVDLIKFHIDLDLQRDVMSYALQNGHKHGLKELVGCEACAFLYRWVSYRMALNLDIPYILDGTDPTQTPPPGFTEGEIIKAAMEQGITFYGKMPELLHAATGERYKDTIYDCDFEQVKDKTFPTLISPFAFLDYDYQEIYRTLEQEGVIAKDACMSSTTNCYAYHLFAHMSYKRFNCHPYERVFANGVRTGIPSHLLQYGDVGNVSREEFIALMEDYRRALTFIAEHKDVTGVQLEDTLRGMCPTMERLYKGDTFSKMMKQMRTMHHYADYYQVDLETFQ